MQNHHKALNELIFYPFWLDNPLAPTPKPPLIGSTETELLIVGGGFTGLWTAIIAKQQNSKRDVVIIEAATIACGASGRPGGIVSTSVMHGLYNASKIFPENLPALERLGIDNLDNWAQTIKDFNIDADLEWSGEMTVAIKDSHKNYLNEEYKLAKQYGHNVVMLDEKEAQAEVNSPLFKAAMWARSRSGTVHPAKLAWGLKRVALELGVRIYEHTPMTHIEDHGTCLHVITHDGRIKAPKVMLATNAFAAGHKHIKRRIAAIRDRILMTEPLTAEQMQRVGWENRQGIYDTRTQLNYTRLTKDNRILYGGRVGYFFNNNTDPAVDRTVASYEQLASYFFNTFPQLSDIKFTHAWSGPIALSTRFAVHFQPYYGGKALYAGGYSGYGVTATRFGARMGLALLDGVDDPDLKLRFASTLPMMIAPEPLRWVGAKLTMYALDEVDKKGGWRALWLKLVHKMGFPL